MFQVGEHRFDLDVTTSRLYGGIVIEGGHTSVSWSLHVAAIPRRINLPAIEDDPYLEICPRIQLSSLHFQVTDWRWLAGTSHVFAYDDVGWLLVAEWERFSHLEISFGQVKGNSIGVQINGIGLQESWPELLGLEVPFTINADVAFERMSIHVQPSARNPEEYALALQNRFLPDFQYGNFKVQKLGDNKEFYGWNVSFIP